MIDGLGKVKSLLAKGYIKQLVVFATGGTPNAATDSIDKLWRGNFSDDE